MKITDRIFLALLALAAMVSVYMGIQALHRVERAPLAAVAITAPPAPAPSRYDNEAARVAVRKAIRQCGLPEHWNMPTKYSAAFHSDTWSTVEPLRKRIESIQKWARGLADKDLGAVYLKELRPYMDSVEEAEAELRTHAEEESVKESVRHAATVPEVRVQEPPCDGVAGGGR